MKSTSKVYIVFALMYVSTTTAYSQDCESYLQQASEFVSQKKYCDAKAYYVLYSKCNTDADVSAEIALCERFCDKDALNEVDTSIIVNTSPPEIITLKDSEVIQKDALNEVDTSIVVSTSAPDIISLKDGEVIQALIQKISESGVTYRLFAYPNGPRYTLEKSEIIKIKYANGSMVVFSDVPPPSLFEPPPVAPTRPASKNEGYPSFYIALTTGASSFGTVSFARITKGGPGIFGADIAYFFNPNFGAGAKLNMGICEVDIGNSNTYNETVTFLGPALYGRLGKGAFAFTVGAGAGLLNWQWEIKDAGALVDRKVKSSPGGFLSAGINCMLSRNFGIGMNVQSVSGSVGDSEIRKPAGIGGTLGINFRF